MTEIILTRKNLKPYYSNLSFDFITKSIHSMYELFNIELHDVFRSDSVIFMDADYSYVTLKDRFNREGLIYKFVSIECINCLKVFKTYSGITSCPYCNEVIITEVKSKPRR